MQLGDKMLLRMKQVALHVLALLLIFSSASFAQDSNAISLLVYPDIRAPYNKVFNDITAGFTDHFQGDVKHLAVKKDASSKVLSSAIGKSQPQLILALGKKSYDLYQEADAQLPLVLGATAQTSLNATGISMIPDASVIMKHLLRLAPEVKHVYVVRRAGRLDGTVEKARAYLGSLQIEFTVRETASLTESANAYKEILDGAPEGSAVWILPGSGLVDNSVLSMALKVAWQKNLVLFSSNPLHVKRGLLFAAYPDNYGMGKSLAKLAELKLSGEGSTAEMRPLQDVLIAVNERTSRHLGIELTNEMKGDIDLLLPAR